MKTIDLRTSLWIAAGTLLAGGAIALGSVPAGAAERVATPGDIIAPSASVLDNERRDDGLAYKLLLHRGANPVPDVAEGRV